MSVLITICARGGSKGIPGKNIRMLNGLPLIAYSIRTAQLFAQGRDAVTALSTDDPAIHDTAAAHGLSTTYRRPLELATDTAGKIPVISDLLRYEEARSGKRFDYVLDLDVTSPMRTAGDLEEAFAILQSDKDAYNLFSVNTAARNPYFNMVEKKDDGYFGLSKQGEFRTRQSAPVVYELNASFYFYRRSFFEDGQVSAITPRSLVYPMSHTCFDLDHPVDFDFMEFLLSSGKLDFVI